MARTCFVSLVALAFIQPQILCQEKVYSGPQPGEKLPPFKVRGYWDDAAGKELDFVKQAAGKPIVLIFLPTDFNRPNFMMTRELSRYTTSLAKNGLATGVIVLAENPSEAEDFLTRWRHALCREAPLGISLDGREGPGSYGLNRNANLTILVGKEGKVTASFALLQPSVQADLPKILEEVAKAAGGPVAKLEELPGVRQYLNMQTGAQRNDPKATALFRQVIFKTAGTEEVEKAAAALEEYLKTNEAARKDLGSRARAIVEGGQLDQTGTPKAREYLRKWAKEHGGLRKVDDSAKQP